MPERLFLFIQFEFPWLLGPPDGRYLLRTREAHGWAGVKMEVAQPERVVVLGTLGAGRLAELGLGRRRSRPRRARPRPTTPDPAPVTTTRATLVDPVSLSAERQAQAWLADLDAELHTRAAIAVLNRVLFAHRIATADPSVHEVSPAQALIIRAGWGEGEQVADGHWLHALELPWSPSSRGRRRGPLGDRSAALRPQERFAELLGARDLELLCEELALRARFDLEAERLPHAAIGLDNALAAALSELGGEDRPDLAPRLAELAELRAGVTRVARGVLPDAGALGDAVVGTASASDSSDASSEAVDATDAVEPVKAVDAVDASSTTEEPDEAVVRHALERLEAALRARTAVGFTRG